MRKIYFAGIALVSAITFAILVWTFFIPESDEFWNTWMIILGVVYCMLLRGFFESTPKRETGILLVKTCGIAIGVLLAGPVVQAFGISLRITGTLPAMVAGEVIFVMTGSLLIAAYPYRDCTITGWTEIMGTIWLGSMAVCLSKDILQVFGCQYPDWAVKTMSVVYPVIFIATLISAVLFVMRHSDRL